MKQFASWFTHAIPHGAALRKQIYESKTVPMVMERVDAFFLEPHHREGEGSNAESGMRDGEC
jgi:hypothetical protein